MQLNGIIIASRYIDNFVIIPGAVGLFLTGLLYSIFANYGWVKHGWVAVKWAICLFGIALGTFWLVPWVDILMRISASEGIAAVEDIAYANACRSLVFWGTIQCVTLLLAVLLSILKPWGNMSKKARPLKIKTYL